MEGNDKYLNNKQQIKENMGILGQGHGILGLPKSKSGKIVTLFILTIILAMLFFKSNWIYGVATLGIGFSIIAVIYNKD